MILAVLILIAVSLFLGWLLVKLAVNALPLFAGVATSFAVLNATDSVGAGASVGLFVALAVAAFGPFAFGAARSSSGRMLLGLMFAIPAAVAAWYAALGITGHVMMAGGGRNAVALLVAFLVGAVAWRRLAERASSWG